MNSIQVVVFCLASFFLGAALALKVIFVLARKNAEQNPSEGCFSNLVTALPLAVALMLFALGILSQL